MRAAALLLLAAARAAPPSAVYIMRHCARSTYLPDLEDEKTYPYLANYSDGGELADWGVAPTLCTARGRAIVRGEGAFMKDEFARYDSLKVFHDSGSQRDTTTAADFLAGLGSSVESVAAPEVFNPMKAKFCPYLTEQESAAAVAAQLEVVHEPDALAARVEVLQEVLGAGVAPAMQNISSEVADGKWRGGAAIAAAWIEAMLLQLGAGIPPAYGRADAADVYALLDIHVYARAINDRPWAIERRGGSNILAHARRDLVEGSGATLYVGHDTTLDQMGVLLNLTFADMPPYPTNTPAPGSILKLEAADDADGGRSVTATYFYVEDFEHDDGALARAGSTTFAGGATSMPLEEFAARANATIDYACVRF